MHAQIQSIPAPRLYTKTNLDVSINAPVGWIDSSGIIYNASCPLYSGLGLNHSQWYLFYIKYYVENLYYALEIVIKNSTVFLLFPLTRNILEFGLGEYILQHCLIRFFFRYGFFAGKYSRLSELAQLAPAGDIPYYFL